ncbi:hypothetical protein OBBRIDRAFT_442048 [Obba rivulosa]|uniref:Uncharacterized protein n=1 Tax=Obba rivulosa TaxID=1052685 RepID=A0A8E2DU54_9APHY|nr:hypothetical protein OBBRIDRAFT_442048 [Obba rivulosa]
MPKPTLVQKLFGQPSQTYYFPSLKDYHSTKSELIRIAATLSEEEDEPDGRENTFRPIPSHATSLSRKHSRRSSATPPRASTSALRLEDDEDEAKRAAIHSIASYPSVHNQPSPHVNRDAPVKYLNYPPPQPPPPPPRTRSVPVRDLVADADTSCSDGDIDIFYTPRSSFYTPQTSPATMAALLEPQAVASALLPPHSYSQNPESDTDSAPVSRTPSGSSISSTCSSHSERDDVFSATSHATTSTPLTTPVSSVQGGPREDDVEAITIASSTRRRPQSMYLSSSAPKVSASERASRRRSQAEVRSVTYTDADWARDVRWLAPPPDKTTSPRRRPRSIPTDLVPTLETLSSEAVATVHLKPPTPAFAAPTPRPGSRSRSKGDRSSRHSNRQSGVRMSALVEEDESEYDTGISSCEPSRASTPVHFDLRSGSSPNLGSTPAAPFNAQSRTLSSPQVQLLSPDARLADYARQQAQGLSRSAPDTLSPLSANEPYSATLPTHALPAPFPSSSSPPANGYTSLTLPRAGYANLKGKALGEGHVDLVRAGVAQSSMATIEVVRGAAALAAAAPKRSSTFSLGRTFSLSLRPKKRRESATPAHLQAAAPLPVTFTVHVAPPSFVPPSHVLVQVFAVALDGLDSLLVQEKVEAGVGAAPEKGKGRKPGFVPGRSFVGKALECGWEVKDEVCKRGEWVMGLLDVRKCGALAEFVLVERHRMYRAPQPRAQTSTLFPPRRRAHTRTLSLPSHQPASGLTPSRRVSSTPTHLSLDQLALLPLCGLPAHRAVRTFADVLAAGRAREDPDRGARVLILQGHDGPGALAMQLLRKTGARVCVQVPESAVRPIEKPSSEPAEDGEKTSKEPRSRREQVEERLLSWGAEEICVGDPLFVIEQLARKGTAFDAILDTVGSVDIWEAAQKLFLLGPTPPASPALSMTSLDETGGVRSKKSRSRAQFTTLVGDMPARAIPSAQDNLKSGFRSLRRSSTASARSGGRRVKRTLGYTWISAAADVDFEGEDVRDSLASVVSMVERGLMKPWIGGGDGEDDEGKVLPFEKAPEAFRRDMLGPHGILKDGGTCVVKICQ